jgi:hypothetical protein
MGWGIILLKLHAKGFDARSGVRGVDRGVNSVPLTPGSARRPRNSSSPTVRPKRKENEIPVGR